MSHERVLFDSRITRQDPAVQAVPAQFNLPMVRCEKLLVTMFLDIFKLASLKLLVMTFCVVNHLKRGFKLLLVAKVLSFVGIRLPSVVNLFFIADLQVSASTTENMRLTSVQTLDPKK